MYDDAIRQGLYPSLRRLSDSLGVNLSDASRAVQLAKLPSEVVAAFASPLELQVRWAKPLADAMRVIPTDLCSVLALWSRRPQSATQAVCWLSCWGSRLLKRRRKLQS